MKRVTHILEQPYCQIWCVYPSLIGSCEYYEHTRTTSNLACFTAFYYGVYSTASLAALVWPAAITHAAKQSSEKKCHLI